jgi:hypothetical protein
MCYRVVIVRHRFYTFDELPPWSKVLIEKLIVVQQLAKKL